MVSHFFFSCILRTSDQFSFYDPDYSPPGQMVATGLVSPPAQLVTVNYVTGLANALFNLPRFGLSVCNGGK